MATYVNNLRLTELATGEGSGTWGTTTNTSLELIGEALGYNTQNCFSSDADATTTVADGASDPARSFYFKVTSSATLSATRTLTIAPNTLSRVMFIENATTGSQSIAISQGSGANVTIATGKTAVVYLDGAGSTAAVVDAMAGVDPGITDTLAEVLVAGNTSGGTNIELTTTDKVQFRDSAIYLNSSADGQLDIVADTEVQIAATTIDINGNVDISGTAGIGGVLTANAGVVVDTITIDGSEIDASSSLSLDIGGNLTIDVDGSTVTLADGGVNFGQFYQNASGQFNINAPTQDKDIVFLGNDGGSSITALTLDMSGAGYATFKSGAVFNEDSAESDFRVESNGNTHALFVDAGNDRVGVFNSSPSTALDVTGNATITTADNSDTLTLISTDADASAGPNLKMYRNSASPADSDELGNILFQGRNDNSQDVVYATIETFALDVSDGTEDAVLNFNVMKAGSSVSFFKGNNTEVVVNDDSNDLDFRVESNGSTHMLFVDAGNNRIGINDTSPDFKLDLLGGNGDQFRLNNGGERFTQMYWATNNAAKGAIWIDSTDSKFEFYGYSGYGAAIHSNATQRAYFHPTSEVVFNELGNDYDFRVESDSNAHMLFVDAGNNRVGINQSSPATTFHINNDTETTSEMTLQGEYQSSGFTNSNTFNFRHGGANRMRIQTTQYSAASDGFALAIEGVNSSLNGFNSLIRAINSAGGSGASVVLNEDSNDQDFRVESNNNNHMLFVDAGNDRVGIATSAPNANGLHVKPSGEAVITIGSSNAGGAVLVLDGDSNGDGAGGDYAFIKHTTAGNLIFDNLNSTGTEIVFNENSNNMDFRVESNNNANMLVVDAGNDRVGVGISPTAPLDVRGANSATFGRGQLYISNTESAAINQGSQISLGGTYSGTADTFLASIAGRKENDTAGNYDGYLSLATRANGGNNTEHMRITSQGFVGINETSPDYRLHVKSGTVNVVAKFESTDSTSVIQFVDSSGNSEFGTSGSTARISPNGSYAVLEASQSAVVINNASQDTDFRVESNNSSHMFFVDAASDEIGILDASPQSALDVAGRVGTRELQFRGGDGASDRINRMLGWGIGNTSSSGSTWRLVGTIDLPDSNYSSISLIVKTTYPGSNYGAYNASGYVWHNQANVTRKTTSVVDNANIYGPYNDKIQLHRNSVGQWELQARSVSDNQALAIEVTILSSSGGAGFETQEGIVAGSTGGTTVTPSGDIQYFSQLSSFQQYGSAVFNENGNDNDFRVESDSNANMLFVDAGNNRVGVGTNGPSTAFHVHGVAGDPGKLTLSEGGAESRIFASRNSDTNGDLNFQTEISGSIATRMRIDYNGKVLIGDTASHTSDLLQIETPASGGGHGIQIRRNDSNNSQSVGRIMFGNNSDADLVSVAAVTYGEVDSAYLNISTASSGTTTQRLRVDADGLKFGTDTAAASALDDYEEGTFTPSWQASTTTVTVNHASYTKVGRMVTVNFYISNISPATSSDTQYIQGLPFTIASGHYPAGSIGYSVIADTANLGVLGGAGTTNIYFHEIDGTSISALTRNDWNSLLSSGLALIISLTYITA